LSVVNHAVQSQRFSWVFVDKNPDSWLPYYLPFFHFFEEEGFFPVTGAPTRPEFGLFRNPVINGGSYPLTDPAFDTFYSDNWKIVQDGRGLVGENGDILIALSAKNSYSLEMQIKPRCEQDRPIINKFTWYWNNSLLVDVSVNDCADIKIGPIKIPQDAISSKYDSLSVTLQEFDQRNDTGNWNFELRELSFDRIDGISKE
jgi:hypothetical protein